MVLVLSACIDILLIHLQASTCHVGLSDSLDLLDAILLTELVEGIVSVVEQLNQVPSIVGLHDLVEACDVNEDDCDFTLCLGEILLALLDARPD